MPNIRLLESPEEMTAVEDLQRQVWPGSETDVVPAHLLITSIHAGGLVIGAFEGENLVGFLFGFPGIESLPDGPRAKHCSHMMGILEAHRDSGIGFALKRAQWQMVRHQGLDHITWTFDPLLSRNAYLNIGRLGAVCNTYLPAYYGQMRDGLNAGLPADRFHVDWWIRTSRVDRRLSKRARGTLKLEAVLKAEIQHLYHPTKRADGWLAPSEHFTPPTDRLALAEIPCDFLSLKAADLSLARDWRFFMREVFQTLFQSGYLVTDFVYDRASNRSLYVLTDGEAEMGNVL